MKELILDKQSIFVTKFEGDLNLINENIKSVQNLDKEGREVSNKNGYQSNAINYGFEELRFEVEKGASQLLQDSVFVHHPWLNINNGFSSNSTHLHLDKTSGYYFYFTCVYYHEVCCENSPVIFETLIPSIFTQKLEYIPKNQDMVFFWGSIPHSVKSCLQENHTRISLAFNIQSNRV